jgi:hypothetical protein
MQEFLLLVHTKGDHLTSFSPEEQQQHVQRMGRYIENLMKTGKIKGAQPLEIAGTLVTGKKGKIKDGPFTETKEVIVGYFHILANDLAEATEIAKANPILVDAAARIEVRPIKSLKGIN